MRGVLERLGAEFPGIAPTSARFAVVPQAALGLEWREQLRAVRVGKRLLITPPWDADTGAGGRAADKARIAIQIDPGQAFGTGHHATTRGCLRLLEEVCAGGPFRRGLDLGCGSGVLAIAMRKLGVKRVLAVDTDPIAREATIAAAACNATDGIRVAARPRRTPPGYDVIAANLYAGLLAELSTTLADLLAPKGVLIVSGLLARQEALVRRALSRAGLRVERRLASPAWVSLALTKRRGPRSASSIAP